METQDRLTGFRKYEQWPKGVFPPNPEDYYGKINDSANEMIVRFDGHHHYAWLCVKEILKYHARTLIDEQEEYRYWIYVAREVWNIKLTTSNQ